MIKLDSKTIRLRLVEEKDAGFILDLRLDDKYNQFLSGVTPDLQAQVNWIRSYKNEENLGFQYYFIIEKLDGTPCGTVRVYDIKEDSFCWGSWILNEQKTHYSAIESAFLIYKFGFDYLNFEKSHFDVMKGNKKVISFHEKLGAKIVSEDDDNYYFNITSYEVDNAKKRLVEKIGAK